MSTKKSSAVKRVEDDDVINLLDLCTHLLRHWWKIILSAILVGVIFLAWTLFMITPLYSSTSILYVVSASTSITSLSDLQIGSYLTTDYIEVVSGRPVLDQVIENLGLDMEYDELYGKVTLTNPDDSRLLEITVVDPDPELAKEIADEIAEVSSLYIAEKMDQEEPTIIQYGYVADEKTSPSYRKNTMMGGILGAVIAIVILCISYLLNDTIMSPEDLEKRVGLNVLASLPMEDTKQPDEIKSSKKTVKKTGKKKTA